LTKQLYGDAALSVTREGDSRQRLNVRIKASSGADLQQLLNNLERD
jgi:hypothetical protein